ncbi:MAG: dTDP-4-amino-4,6-dideoxyglucose formyltransferase [Desulfovibrio sp.]|nr:dTDP-4-amino-4,6-dideoxyglucose formyltransferase [Desulfovibrio sp.]
MFPLTRVLVLSDNTFLLEGFRDIVHRQNCHASFTYRQSPSGPHDVSKTRPSDLPCLDIRKACQDVIKNYDLILSLHSKQVFPKEVVEHVRCVNIHPGYNPHNRGWFPQVFSLCNGLPAGVTIHEMDAQIDHGDIIYREEIFLCAHDDSLSAYQKILNKELEMLEAHLVDIVDHTYTVRKPEKEGNINFKKDYYKLCHLDLQETLTMGEAINRLRALTHGDYDNAYFLDTQGKKIYVRLHLYPEDANSTP